jgi:hypothetical protein
MRNIHIQFCLSLPLLLCLPLACEEDPADSGNTAETPNEAGDDPSETGSDPEAGSEGPGDGGGDGDGDGDGDPSGDGDGDPPGDGDGDPSGDGDGDGDGDNDTGGVCEPSGDDCGDCMAMNCCAEVEECLTDADCSCFQECAAANPDDPIGCADPDACNIPLLTLLDSSTVVGRMGICTQTNCAQCL